MTLRLEMAWSACHSDRRREIVLWSRNFVSFRSSSLIRNVENVEGLILSKRSIHLRRPLGFRSGSRSHRPFQVLSTMRLVIMRNLPGNYSSENLTVDIVPLDYLTRVGRSMLVVLLQPGLERLKRVLEYRV
jgi:hypothetical protein